MSHSVLTGADFRAGARRSLRAICAAFLLPGLFAVPGNSADDTSFANFTPGLPNVTVAVVVESEVVGRVPISGTLVPLNEALIFPEVNGHAIAELLVDVGDTVEQGDVLARLNDRTLAAQLAQAQAEFARAEAGVGQAQSQIVSAQANATQANSALDRTRRLLESGTTTQSVLDQSTATAQTADANLASAEDGLTVARAALQQAQAALDIAQLNFERATIHAPVSGVISARNGQIGAIATSAGEPIFRIITEGRIEVEAEVIETALGQVTTGAPAELDIASIGAVKGTVRRVSPVVNPQNRLGTIRIALNVDRTLRTGLFANGWIITARRDARVVPATAVLSDIEGNYVLVSLDGVLEKRRVSAGLIWQDMREIVDGLDIGEKVVAKAGAFFADGDRITPLETSGSTADAAQ